MNKPNKKVISIWFMVNGSIPSIQFIREREGQEVPDIDTYPYVGISLSSRRRIERCIKRARRSRAVLSSLTQGLGYMDFVL